MERTEILNRMAALREKERTVFDVYFERWESSMEGKTSVERRNSILFGTVYTEDERRNLDEIRGKIKGFRHMLNEGFFQKPRAVQPLTPEEKRIAEVLY